MLHHSTFKILSIPLLLLSLLSFLRRAQAYRIAFVFKKAIQVTEKPKIHHARNHHPQVLKNLYNMVGFLPNVT
jgi:hypothetical protein